MHLLFIISAFAGLAYFLLAKRRFDLFSLAHISACVYFLPGFVGFVSDGPQRGVRIDVAAGAYEIMIAVLAAITLAGVLYDRFPTKPRLQDDESESNTLAAHLALAIALAGTALTFHTSGSALFSVDKSDVTESLTRWIIPWMFGASFAAVLAFQQRQRLTFLIAMGLLALSVYVGFRAACALTVIAIFTLYLSRSEPQRLLLVHWRTCVVGAGCAGFFFVYKLLYRLIKAGEFETAAEKIGDPEFYTSVLVTSEPFGVQAILNETVRADFQTGMGYIAQGVIAQFLIVPDKFDISVISFNDFFQPALFPDADYGMGSNIWAQMTAGGGWPLLGAFLAVFVAVLAIGSRCLDVKSQSVRAALALAFSYWAFYIHRNDIAYELTMVRRIFYIWLICVLVSSAARRLSSSRTRRNAPTRLELITARPRPKVRKFGEPRKQLPTRLAKT